MSDIPTLRASSAVVAVAKVPAHLLPIMRYVAAIGSYVTPIGMAVNSVMPQIAAINATVRA